MPPRMIRAQRMAGRVIAGPDDNATGPMTHAVLPKDVWLAERELEVPWPMFGMPRLLHLDNASEFHSETLARAPQQHGIRLEFRPIAEPHFGARAGWPMPSRARHAPSTPLPRIPRRPSALGRRGDPTQIAAFVGVSCG